MGGLYFLPESIAEGAVSPLRLEGMSGVNR